MTDKSKIIVVDGNIGAGKSVVAKELADKLGMRHIPEATPQYTPNRSLGHDIDEKFIGDVSIEKFYEDPLNKNGHSFGFQFSMYTNRYYQMVDAIKHVMFTAQGVVLERSVYSDVVFAEAMNKMGYLDAHGPNRMKIYDELVFFSLYKLVKPHVVVYLDVPVDQIHDRIMKRGHEMEKSISKKYLEEIDTAYKTRYLPTVNEGSILLEYDWANPIYNVERILEDYDLVTDKEWEGIDWNKLSDKQIYNLYDFCMNEQDILNKFCINTYIPEWFNKPGELEMLEQEFRLKYKPYPQTIKGILEVMMKPS